MYLPNLFQNPILYLSFVLIITTNFLYAQAPVVEWQKCLGSSDGEDATNIQVTSDGGYVVVGSAFGADAGDVMGHHGNATVGDIWVVKLDKSGHIQWQKSLGGTDSEVGAYIQQTTDGGYIVAGSAASSNCNFTGNHGGFDFCVIRLNNKGDIIWQKMYGGTKEDYAVTLSKAVGGGYFIAGYTLSNDGDVKGNHGGMDWWVIKIHDTGNLIWQKCLGGTKNEGANSIQSTADGGCIVTGWEESNNGDVTSNHGIGDYWLVRLDKSGNVQWQKTYGGSALDEARCVSVTDDGGYIVAGYSGSFDGDVSDQRPGNYDIWILKVDKTGNVQWKKCYGGSGNELAYFIQSTLDGGYVVAGSSTSANDDLTCNAGRVDGWIFKINTAGDLQWQRSIGGSNSDELRSIQPLSNGDLIVAGNTSSPNVEGYHQPLPGKYIVEDSDFWIIKLSVLQTSTPQPGITFDPSAGKICPNALAAIKVEATFSGLKPTYFWTRNGTATGTNSAVYAASDFQDNDLITCTVTSGDPACNNSGLQASKALTLHTSTNVINPSIQITADNTFVCDCTTNNFKATVINGGSAPLYQWQINGQTAGFNSPVFSSNTLKSRDAVTCVYADNTSCVTGGSVMSNTIQIDNGSANTASVNITPSADTICAGGVIIFNANAINAGDNPVYQWKLNNTNVGNNSPTYNSNNFSAGDQVSCIVTIINPCLNTSITSNIVAVKVSSPIIKISPPDTLINSGSQLQLFGNITGGTNTFYWTPADKLENPTALSPTTIHLMDDVTYTLNAVNKAGCTATKSVTVKMFKLFYLPNAFTPNGDGINDVFRIPPNTPIRLKEFSIYNSWGAKIFSTQNISQGWDGNINTKQQIPGVYVYIIKGSNENGSVFLKGSFMLIR